MTGCNVTLSHLKTANKSGDRNPKQALPRVMNRSDFLAEFLTFPPSLWEFEYAFEMDKMFCCQHSSIFLAKTAVCWQHSSILTANSLAYCQHSSILAAKHLAYWQHSSTLTANSLACPKSSSILAANHFFSLNSSCN